MREALDDDPTSVLQPKFASLLAHALKLTHAPSTCSRDDIECLRAAGATDPEIHATVQVAAYFNYINRVADALGVDLEPEMRIDQDADG